MQNDAELEKILEQSGLKKTPARRLVLSVLREAGLLTPAEIQERARERGGTFNLSTVYRTCESLAEKGVLLQSPLMEDGLTRYEFVRAGHIHHAVCLGCQKIIPIDDCPFGEFARIMREKYGFDAQKHRIEIYGYCADCRAAGRDPDEARP